MTLITNDQEAFEFVKNHLLTQNAKSMADDHDCLYRGYSSTKIEELRNEADRIVLEENIEDEDYELDIYRDLLAEANPDAMCAVGCLILDDFYDDDMEGKTIEPDEFIWEAVVKSNPAWKMTESSYDLLQKLQSIHDREQPEFWRSRLSELNTKFNEYGDYKGSL